MDEGHSSLLVEKDAFNSKRKIDKRYSHLEYVLFAHFRGRYKTEVISQANKRVPGYTHLKRIYNSNTQYISAVLFEF